MFNFDEARYERIQTGAVSLAAPLHSCIGELLQAGARNLYLLGTGGAGILMYPAVSLLQRESSFPVYLDYPAEILHTPAPNLGKGSIVVIPSLSGTTPESQEVLAFAQAKGATVIALTGDASSPLAVAADHTFTNPAADDTSSESFYLQSLLVALSVMSHRGEIDDYEQVVAELAVLPAALLDLKAQAEEVAPGLASAIASEDYHIITGPGSVWAEAFYFGMCILEEMQWIRTRPVHSSDFFHGTLELVEKGVSILLFKGEDAARPLAERLEAFVPQVTDKLTVLDSASFALPGISERVRALISPVVLAAVLERVGAYLEVERRHPLVTRRYYRRLGY